MFCYHTLQLCALLSLNQLLYPPQWGETSILKDRGCSSNHWGSKSWVPVPLRVLVPFRGPQNHALLSTSLGSSQKNSWQADPWRFHMLPPPPPPPFPPGTHTPLTTHSPLLSPQMKISSSPKCPLFILSMTPLFIPLSFHTGCWNVSYSQQSPCLPEDYSLESHNNQTACGKGKAGYLLVWLRIVPHILLSSRECLADPLLAIVWTSCKQRIQ